MYEKQRRYILLFISLLKWTHAHFRGGIRESTLGKLLIKELFWNGDDGQKIATDRIS